MGFNAKTRAPYNTLAFVYIISTQSRRKDREETRKNEKDITSSDSAAKATVSRAKARPVASTTSQWYSTVPPPKDTEEGEEEEAEEEETKMIPFPSHIPGGLVVKTKKKKGPETSTGKNKQDKSSSGQDYGQGQGTNGAGKPDYGGGCSGCPGCSRCGCPGCDGGCKFCFGCDSCKY